MKSLSRLLLLLLAFRASSAAADTVSLRIPAGPRPVDGWPVILGNTMRHTPAIADIDGNGRDEIAVGLRDGRVFLLDAHGRPLAGWPRETDSWVHRSPLLDDIDGDGRYEVCAVTMDGMIHLWRVDGSPSPGWPLDLGDAPASSPRFVRVGADAENRILVAVRPGRIHLLRPDGSPCPGWPKTLESTTDAPVEDRHPTAVADLDGDGSPEILHLSSREAILYAWRLDGTNYPGFPRSLGDQTGGMGLSLDSASRPSVIACTSVSELSILSVAGSLLHKLSPLDDGDMFASSPYFISSDTRLQGKADCILAGSRQGTVYLWDLEGRLMPGWPVKLGGFIYGVQENRFFHAVHGPPLTSDVDGDGELEIILGCYNHHLYAFELDGRLVPGWPETVEDGVSGAIALAELDGDGKKELVVGQIGETMFAFHLAPPPPVQVDIAPFSAEPRASLEWPPAYSAAAAAVALMLLLLALHLRTEHRLAADTSLDRWTRAAIFVVFAILLARAAFFAADIMRYGEAKARLAMSDATVRQVLANERRLIRRAADELVARLDTVDVDDMKTPLRALPHLERLADHYRFDYNLKGLLVTDSAGNAVIGVGLARGWLDLEALGIEDRGQIEPILLEETPVFVEESERGIGAGPDSLRFFLFSSLLGAVPDAVADATGFSAYLRLEDRTLAWGGAAIGPSPRARPRIDRTQPSRDIALSNAPGVPRVSIRLAMENFERTSSGWMNVVTVLLLPLLYLYLSGRRMVFERVRLAWWWIPLFGAAYVAGIIVLGAGTMEARQVSFAGRILEVILRGAVLLGFAVTVRNIVSSRKSKRLDVELLGSYLFVSLIPLAAILFLMANLIRDIQYRVVQNSIAELAERADNLAISFVGRYDFFSSLDAEGRKLLHQPPETGWFNFVKENHFLFTYDLPSAFVTLWAHDRSDPTRYFTGYSYRATRTDKLYSRRPAWMGSDTQKGLFLDNGRPVIRALRTFRTRTTEAEMGGHVPFDEATLRIIEKRLRIFPFFPDIRLKPAWPESIRGDDRGHGRSIPLSTDILLHARDWHTGRPRWIACRARAYLPPGREKWAVILPVVLLLLLPLGLSAWGAYSTFQWTVQPLKRLLVGIRRVEEGDMDYRLKDTGQSEIAAAARSFDRMAESLEAKIAELAEKKKVEEVSDLKSHFISMVSHDLKTPLASIKGAAENILEELAGPVSDRQRAYLEMILRSSDNLQQMIANLLDLSRIESGHMTLDIEAVDLKRETEHILRFLQPLLDKKEIEARIVVGAKKTVIAADRARLWQIFNNILANAIRYSPAGGRIDIFIDDVPAVDAGERAMIQTAIVDQGPGISEAEVSKLFEPFYTRPSEPVAAHGAGLGLAIVKQLVELHGGRVSLKRAEQGGARFTFTLPVNETE